MSRAFIYTGSDARVSLAGQTSVPGAAVTEVDALVRQYKELIS